MKNVSVVVSGAAAGDVREVTLLPGVTASDVLRDLQLDGYILSLEGSVQAFAAEESLYNKVVDHGKLRASPVADFPAIPSTARTSPPGLQDC